jgi:hypothetical protein
MTDHKTMTDYNVEVLDASGSQEYEYAIGTLTLDGVRRHWVYDGCAYMRSTGYHVYEALPKETPIKTRQRLKDGTKLRRIPISDRKDHPEISAAIKQAVDSFFETDSNTRQ